jgi:hypothetical protein
MAEIPADSNTTASNPSGYFAVLERPAFEPELTLALGAGQFEHSSTAKPDQANCAGQHRGAAGRR